MSSNTWTPAPTPGLFPLHPLTFGQVLGTAFKALRANPKVLLGFAIGFQALATVIQSGVMMLIFIIPGLRLETVSQSSDDFETMMVGTAALMFLIALPVSLLTAAFTVIVQGIVAADVAAAAVGERATLRMLWSRVRPSVWRLIGYTFLVGLGAAIAIVALVFVVVGPALLLGSNGPVFAIFMTLLVAAVAVGLGVWLSTKLCLAPSAIVIEHTGIFAAIARSWKLVRGRFWPIFAVILVISGAFSIASSTIGGMFQMIGGMASGAFNPTGGSDTVTAMIAMIAPSAIVQALIGAVSSVVVSSATTTLYIDARMRKEGLDVTLLQYMEQRDLTGAASGDPYHYDPAAVPQPSPYLTYGGYAPPPYGAAPYGPPMYGQAPLASPGYPSDPYGQPGYGQPGYGQPAYGEPSATQPASLPDPYAQPPYAQAPLAQPPYGQTPQSAGPLSAAPYSAFSAPNTDPYDPAANAPSAPPPAEEPPTSWARPS